MDHSAAPGIGTGPTCPKGWRQLRPPALTGSEALILTDNRISDLTPLATLTGLTILVLTDNKITDLSALSDLDGLEVLYLDGNEVTDLKPLERLPGLLHVVMGEIPPDGGARDVVTRLETLGIQGTLESEAQNLPAPSDPSTWSLLVSRSVDGGTEIVFNFRCGADTQTRRAGGFALRCGPASRRPSAGVQ